MSNKTRPLRSAREMYPVIKSYLESGLTQKQFYEQHNLPQWIFIYWLRHYRKSKDLSNPGSHSTEHKSSGHFLSLTVDQPASCQLNLSGGVRVHIGGLSDARMAAVLNVLLGL